MARLGTAPPLQKAAGIPIAMIDELPRPVGCHLATSLEPSQ
ncbi:hypothetical protein MPNT_390011 [Candidatus Methylacidithermus pantelleriae]|uniref:Uncharacterized protein n=1 Tax=Candidatus Methylacidithermus pantelleriae TaxID=2744239 RepID=A0A8J2BN07_9BACT|nr:hypothetical protein MPNT_390011 [Candidatus Methylacidithermus pantelleriae]